jgi:hypothetical protein
LPLQNIISLFLPSEVNLLCRGTSQLRSTASARVLSEVSIGLELILQRQSLLLGRLPQAHEAPAILFSASALSQVHWPAGRWSTHGKFCQHLTSYDSTKQSFSMRTHCKSNGRH